MKTRDLLGPALVILFPSLLAAHVDGMQLAISLGASQDEVDLDWTGGGPTYHVYRSSAPANLLTSTNHIGDSQVREWVDQPGPGGIFFYELTSDCQYNPPEICDGLDNDCNGVLDGPGSEIACSLPNATSACIGGSCAIAGCLTGFNDCDASPADGCEVNNHIPQSTSPAIYAGSTNADLKAGCARVSAITNCGACGVSCEDGDACSTDLCVPMGQAGGEVGVCRHFNRAQCSEARHCDLNLLPPPLEPACVGQDADLDGCRRHGKFLRRIRTPTLRIRLQAWI
jgi:hypothetical protein